MWWYIHCCGAKLLIDRASHFILYTATEHGCTEVAWPHTTTAALIRSAAPLKTKRLLEEIVVVVVRITNAVLVVRYHDDFFKIKIRPPTQRENFLSCHRFSREPRTAVVQQYHMCGTQDQRRGAGSRPAPPRPLYSSPLVRAIYISPRLYDKKYVRKSSEKLVRA